MRVLLIQPPVEDFFYTPARSYPLGLVSLGTVLEQHGYTVRILNCIEGSSKQTLPFPQKFSYLKKYYHQNISPFRLFSHYYRFGYSPEFITEEIRAFRPSIVGISANFSAYLDSSLAVASLVKQVDPRIAVVMGGRGATVHPQVLMENKSVDFVLKGESEYTLIGLCASLSTGKRLSTRGLCYRRQGKTWYSPECIIIKDLDSIPLLNRKLIPCDQYTYQGVLSTSLLSSRGCIMHCRFCAIQETYRYRSAAAVLEEIGACYRLGIRHFNFEDDTMNLHPGFDTILEGIIGRHDGNIRISFMNGLLTKGLTQARLKRLIAAGLTHVDFSIASTDAAMRKRLARTEQKHRLTVLAERLSRAHVPVTLHYIVGFPAQRLKHALGDVRALAAERVLLGPSIFYPVVESPLFATVQKTYGCPVSDYAFFRSSAAYFDNNIHRDEIMTLVCAARIINFIKTLLDTYPTARKDFMSFVRETSAVFKEDNGRYLYPAAADRNILGVLLLQKLLQQRSVYRAQRQGQGVRLIREDFISLRSIQRIFGRLLIRSVAGYSVRLP